MLFLRAGGLSLGRLEAPTMSFFNSFSKTTKVALGVLGAGVVVAATAAAFGAISLAAGAALAVGGAAIYAYGRVQEARERKNAIKFISNAPKELLIVGPQPQAPRQAPPSAPSENGVKPMVHVQKGLFIGEPQVKPRVVAGKENKPPVNNVFRSASKPLSPVKRQMVLA